MVLYQIFVSTVTILGIKSWIFRCSYSSFQPLEFLVDNICGFCRKSVPSDSRYFNGYKLCPSSRRNLSVFIWSGFHTVFALNGTETVSISVQSHRFIDDVLFINSQEFENYLGQIKDTTEHHFCSSRFTTFDWEGRSSSHLHLQDDFNFHITNVLFLSSYISSWLSYGLFISAYTLHWACSSYECFILRVRRLSSKVLKQEYLLTRLKSLFMKFYGWYEDLIQQSELSPLQIINDI